MIDAQTVPEFDVPRLLFLFLPGSFLLHHLPPSAPPESALSSAPCPLLVLPQSDQVGDALRMRERGLPPAWPLPHAPGATPPTPRGACSVHGTVRGQHTYFKATCLCGAFIHSPAGAGWSIHVPKGR